MKKCLFCKKESTHSIKQKGYRKKVYLCCKHYEKYGEDFKKIKKKISY